MAIELITGALGSGKTTFMVAKRLTEEQGRPFEYEDANGTMRPAKRRLVVAGIDKLLVEHERLPHTLTGDVVRKKDIEFWNQEDENGEPLFKRLPEDPPVEFVLDAKGCRRDVEASLFNWWLWVLPGDLIVCDEIQYIVPRGTMGRQPPHYIKMMEFSRHYGADFLFGTQHPQLLDMTIRNLVNPHRHVRSVMGSSLCTIYVWDHASNPERITLSTKT
ncbi:MAG: zonular occludens toxin domain-containing protein, partial [Candidatus Binatia bacterium]